MSFGGRAQARKRTRSWDKSMIVIKTACSVVDESGQDREQYSSTYSECVRRVLRVLICQKNRQGRLEKR